MKKLVSVLLVAIFLVAIALPVSATSAGANQPNLLTERMITPRFSVINRAGLSASDTYVRGTLTAKYNCNLYIQVTIYNQNGKVLAEKDGSTYSSALSVTRNYPFVSGYEYSIEGYYEADGETTSIYDTFIA